MFNLVDILPQTFELLVYHVGSTNIYRKKTRIFQLILLFLGIELNILISSMKK